MLVADRRVVGPSAGTTEGAATDWLWCWGVCARPVSDRQGVAGRRSRQGRSSGGALHLDRAARGTEDSTPGSQTPRSARPAPTREAATTPGYRWCTPEHGEGGRRPPAGSGERARESTTRPATRRRQPPRRARAAPRTACCVVACASGGVRDRVTALHLVSCAVSSWLKCGMLCHGTNWTSQAGVGAEWLRA